MGAAPHSAPGPGWVPAHGKRCSLGAGSQEPHFVLPLPAAAQHDTCCEVACVQAIGSILALTPVASPHWLYREPWSVTCGSGP